MIIGSISKQITAALVLQEWEKGNLSLQDPVKNYLPELQENWADSVSIHHLLNHSSGITAPDQALAFRPGTQFAYSPIVGYELLAKIIEKSSGESYVDLAKKLFDSCKMKDTSLPALYDAQPASQKKLVKSYSEQADGTFVQEQYALKDIVFATSSGGMISTAEDLMLWNECLHQGKVLQEEAYRVMTRSSIARPNHRWGEIGYGYGIQISEQDQQLEYSHSGALLGFVSTNIYYPESKTSLIVLENMTWDFEEMERAFFFHDQLRKIVKESLLP